MGAKKEHSGLKWTGYIRVEGVARQVRRMIPNVILKFAQEKQLSRSMAKAGLTFEEQLHILELFH